MDQNANNIPPHSSSPSSPSPNLEQGGNSNPNPPSEVPPPSPLPPPSMSNTDKIKLVTRVSTILTIVVSIPMLMAGVCLLFMKDYECEQFLKLERLRLTIGIGFIVVFFLSSVIAHYSSHHLFLIAGFLVVMIPFVLMFMMGLALVGVNKTESRGVAASPVWLKLQIDHVDNWINVKKCIYDAQVCDNFGVRMMGLNWRQFSETKKHHVEDGCCRPPTICGMQYVNATHWKDPPTRTGGGDQGGVEYEPMLGGDCSAWSNDETILCYDCHSCKAGFRRAIQIKWSHLGTFQIIISLLLMLLHLIRFGSKHMEKHNQ